MIQNMCYNINVILLSKCIQKEEELAGGFFLCFFAMRQAILRLFMITFCPEPLDILTFIYEYCGP